MDPNQEFMVISREHHLLPLAHKLKNIEGLPTNVIVWKKAFERAWSGLIEKTLSAKHKEIHRENVSKLVEAAAQDNVHVISDVPSVQFEGPHVYATADSEFGKAKEGLRVGFWWDGDNVHAPHILCFDMGTNYGGMGLREEPGGVTLIDLSEEARSIWFTAINDEVQDWLRGSDFKGLINVDVIEVDGRLSLGGWDLGWPKLHTQVFMSAIKGSFSRFLLGNSSIEFSHRYTVALPVSIPPWPNNPESKMRGVSPLNLPIKLNSKLHKHVFFHDVQVDVENKQLSTAETDGLIGVVHASANNAVGAIAKTVQIAGLLEVDNSQYRTDVGVNVTSPQGQRYLRLHKLYVHKDFSLKL